MPSTHATQLHNYSKGAVTNVCFPKNQGRSACLLVAGTLSWRCGVWHWLQWPRTCRCCSAGLLCPLACSRVQQRSAAAAARCSSRGCSLQQQQAWGRCRVRLVAAAAHFAAERGPALGVASDGGCSLDGGLQCSCRPPPTLQCCAQPAAALPCTSQHGHYPAEKAAAALISDNLGSPFSQEAYARMICSWIFPAFLTPSTAPACQSSNRAQFTGRGLAPVTAHCMPSIFIFSTNTNLKQILEICTIQLSLHFSSLDFGFSSHKIPSVDRNSTDTYSPNVYICTANI